LFLCRIARGAGSARALREVDIINRSIIRQFLDSLKYWIMSACGSPAGTWYLSNLTSCDKRWIGAPRACPDATRLSLSTCRPLCHLDVLSPGHNHPIHASAGELARVHRGPQRTVQLAHLGVPRLGPAPIRRLLRRALFLPRPAQPRRSPSILDSAPPRRSDTLGAVVCERAQAATMRRVRGDPGQVPHRTLALPGSEGGARREYCRTGVSASMYVIYNNFW
jgi:hypothetical protein